MIKLYFETRNHTSKRHNIFPWTNRSEKKFKQATSNRKKGGWVTSGIGVLRVRKTESTAAVVGVEKLSSQRPEQHSIAGACCCMCERKRREEFWSERGDPNFSPAPSESSLENRIPTSEELSFGPAVAMGRWYTMR